MTWLILAVLLFGFAAGFAIGLTRDQFGYAGEPRQRILDAMRDKDWMTGADIMFGASVAPDRFYPEIYELEAAMLVEAKWTETANSRGFRRRLYRLS